MFCQSYSTSPADKLLLLFIFCLCAAARALFTLTNDMDASRIVGCVARKGEEREGGMQEEHRCIDQARYQLVHDMLAGERMHPCVCSRVCTSMCLEVETCKAYMIADLMRSWSCESMCLL